MVVEVPTSGPWSEFRPAFNRYTQAFGVTILAAEDVDNKKLLHANKVLAQYLDNNMDGTADNGVAATLAKANAVILLTKDITGYNSFLEKHLEGVLGAGRTKQNMI
jgi:hypothetical protein